MINFKTEMSIYDKFIDNKELSTKELLELGLNSHDLTKLVNEGKIRRVRRGFYDLDKCDGLFNYASILASRKYKNYDRFQQAIKRCLEIDPNNGKVHTRLFLDSLHKNNFEQAIESIKVLSNGENEAYNRDANLWLFMLSFITELDEDLREKVSSLKLEDVLTLEDDLRYEDKLSQNKIRSNIFNYKFSQASDTLSSLDIKKKPIYILITEKLLSMVKYYDIKNQNNISNLLVDGKYDEVRELLIKNRDLHGLSVSDKEILIILEDLIGVINDKKIPEVENMPDSDYLFVEIQKHNYERALQLYRDFSVKNVSRSVKSVGLLLERINEEISKLRKEDLPRTLSVGSDVFVGITNSLQSGDVDKAFLLLDQYLESINKKQYKNYIANLIKLDVLNGDRGFVESMHELSCVGRDRELFDVALYIQDFYFNLINKNFMKAAVYLNLISMSKSLGGVEVEVSQMRRTLIDEAFKNNIKESDLGLLSAEDLVVVEEDLSEEIVAPEMEDLPITYTLGDAIDDVVNEVNLLMLEPMSDEEIDFVTETCQATDCVQSIVIEEEDGSKRVFLRYYDKNGPYVDISGTLRLANYKYKNREYEEAIELFERVLPKIENPRSFIYSKLGIAYRNITKDNDYSKAIDYLTLATAASSSEEDVRDYTDLINKLKFRTNYNGVVLTKK